MTTVEDHRTLTMRWSITHALDEELARDDRVCLIGQDIGRPGGTFGLTRGLQDKYGAARVRDAPISEEGLANLALGAAIAGSRPVLEIMFMDFLALTMDALANQAAQTFYLSDGAIRVPMVVRTLAGAGFRVGSHHSQSFEAWFTHVPGIKVAYPATPSDAKGLLKAAIRDDNPVLFCEHKALLADKGPVPDSDHVVPLGEADVKRAGTDVTLVAYGRMVHVVLDAAERLAAEGIEVEVVDPRTLLPLDTTAILESVAKTSRLAIVHEARGPGGVGAEIAARVADEALYYLDAPIKRITGACYPIPVGEAEDLLFPDVARVIDEVRELVR